MADKVPPQTLETEIASSSYSDSEVDESSEEELMQLAEKIQQYRSTLPNQIKNTLGSLLSSQRPHLPSSSQFAQPQPEISGDRHPDAGDSTILTKDALLAEEDPETAEKIRLLKHKISNNSSAMPIMLKRMNNYISRFEKLDTYVLSIHPTLKRRRAS